MVVVFRKNRKLPMLRIESVEPINGLFQQPVKEASKGGGLRQRRMRLFKSWYTVIDNRCIVRWEYETIDA